MSKEDNIKKEFIKNQLLNNKGYLSSTGVLKKGYAWLAAKFDCTQALIKDCVREIKEEQIAAIKPIDREKLQAKTIFNINKNLSDGGNVLIISDTHFPFERKGSLDFCNDIKNKYNCKTIIHIGDEIDNCAISQYTSDPDGLSAESEASLALKTIKEWYKAFPKVGVCIGNHTNRMFRLAHTSGIPKRMMKSYEELWEAPEGWIWADSFDIQGVHYSHGSGMSGANAALKKAIQLRKSCVIGHIHTEATIQYNVSAIDRIFGMQVGCLVDDKAYAFAYAKDNAKKSILSCGVVVENGTLPIIELMKI